MERIKQCVQKFTDPNCDPICRRNISLLAAAGNIRDGVVVRSQPENCIIRNGKL